MTFIALTRSPLVLGLSTGMASKVDQAVRLDQTLKARKEEFVSNLSGGDVLEINLVIGVATVSLEFCTYHTS